jgi:bifunctional non-homologous end joining protein LigD
MHSCTHSIFSNWMASICAGSQWSDRRWRLAKLLRNGVEDIRLSDHIDGTDGQTIFRHACAMGLEGIVAKRRDRPYRSGRSPDWIKVKNPDAPAVTRLIEG